MSTSAPRAINASPTIGTHRGLGLGFGGLGGMYVERLDLDFGKGRSPCDWHRGLMVRSGGWPRTRPFRQLACRTTPLSVRFTRTIGWLLLGCGVGVLLYLAYALLFTNVETALAQRALREQWHRQIPAAAPRAPERDAGLPRDGPALALIEFTRPGRRQVLINDEPLVVLDDITANDLAAGPGHYPGTALPGQHGNFAIAGHRTTHGAPFFHLDMLRSGDRVVVTARSGQRFAYRVTRQRVVRHGDTWVIGNDPLGTGAPTLTLTTCNPRFSAAQRPVVRAQLVT